MAFVGDDLKNAISTEIMTSSRAARAANLLPLINQINNTMMNSTGVTELSRGKSESGYRSNKPKAPLIVSDAVISSAILDNRRYKSRQISQ